MDNVLILLSIAGTAVILYYGFRYVLDMNNYTPQHTPKTVNLVEQDYCPDGVELECPELWTLRIEQCHTIRGCVADLIQRGEQYAEQAKEALLSNWRWMNVSTDEWPNAWKVPQ